MNKNVAIVHYNTPDFMEHLIPSIFKHTPDARIFIFDNSDKFPYVPDPVDNIVYLDNTYGQIINFDVWLSQFPNRLGSAGSKNKWASAKHSISIQKCMDIIDESFVLLDSDVLVKNDLSELYNENVIFSGEIITQPNHRKRIAPFCCFINTELCKQRNIHYFYPEYMHGLCVTMPGDSYDTGAGFYLKTLGIPYKSIQTSDYIIHYGNGSWDGHTRRMNLTHEQFFDVYKDLWN